MSRAAAGPARKYPSAKCPECGRVIRVRPVGGDWLNALRVFRHKKPGGLRCLGNIYDLDDKSVVWPDTRKST